jgi:polyribonucleotide nucleotidyltransferase
LQATNLQKQRLMLSQAQQQLSAGLRFGMAHRLARGCSLVSAVCQKKVPVTSRATALVSTHRPKRRPADAPPEVGSIHRARVASVRPFGAFVDLPGYRKQALVHHSQVGGQGQ